MVECNQVLFTPLEGMVSRGVISEVDCIIAGKLWWAYSLIYIMYQNRILYYLDALTYCTDVFITGSNINIVLYTPLSFHGGNQLSLSPRVL